VVQINKVSNASAPSYNQSSEHAPRMLSLTLSDGHTTCSALEVAPIPTLRYVYVVATY
jgi:tudor domain-containing protein 3